MVHTSDSSQYTEAMGFFYDPNVQYAQSLHTCISFIFLN